MSTLFFFDLETTGLPTRRDAPFTDTKAWPRIVSISWAVHGTTGHALERYSALVQPVGYRSAAEAAAIHGITTERATRDGQPIETVLGDLLACLQTRAPQALVAHNVEFDRNVLLSELVRGGVDTSLQRLPMVCTMKSTVEFCRMPGTCAGQYKWPKLSELHQRVFGHGFAGEHDAQADVEACVRCYFELMKRGVLRLPV